MFASPAEFVTPRAILTGHDCEVTCASVCAELGLVISGCRGKANHTHIVCIWFICVFTQLGFRDFREKSIRYLYAILLKYKVFPIVKNAEWSFRFSCV